MDVYKVLRLHPTITQCELMLEHSSRETGDYWLWSTLAIYADGERKRVIQTGPGSKDEASRLIQELVNQGFKQTGRRLNQEWEHLTFERDVEKG